MGNNTRLLCSRRLLKTLDKENTTGNSKPDIYHELFLIKEADGNDVNFEELCAQKSTYRPFKCYLDLGLVRATKGNRIFATMKGAIDSDTYSI